MNTEQTSSMKNDLEQIWCRLSTYQFDEPGTSLTFITRLVKQNGWAFDQAKRAVEEYKKFLFLTVAAGHPVTPSDRVDQVWHLHLSYTRNYWEKLCCDTLNTPLHHEPSRGGTEENQKFNRWYQNTLESYKAVFGEEPPSDIWPPPEVRFCEVPYFRRIKTLSHLVISKMSLYTSGMLLGLAALVSCAVGGSGQELNKQGKETSSLQGMWQLLREWCYDNPGTAAFIVVVVLIVSTTSRRSNRSGGGCSTGCGGCGGD